MYGFSAPPRAGWLFSRAASFSVVIISRLPSANCKKRPSMSCTSFVLKSWWSPNTSRLTWEVYDFTSSTSGVGEAMPVSGDYTVGQRVEHPKFGVGIVQRIETLATDHKLVVAFDGAGEKTLLAKFAKLTKL